MEKLKIRERWIKFLIACTFILLLVIMIRAEDPPPKKKPEKDTTKIDIEQQQMVNAEQGKRSLKMDSLLMQVDSLKRKK